MELYKDQSFKNNKDEGEILGQSKGNDLDINCPLCQIGSLKSLASKTTVCERCGFRHNYCFNYDGMESS